MKDPKDPTESSEELRERIRALVSRADEITRQSDMLKQQSEELREEARKLLDKLHDVSSSIPPSA